MRTLTIIRADSVMLAIAVNSPLKVLTALDTAFDRAAFSRCWGCKDHARLVFKAPRQPRLSTVLPF